VNINLYFDVVQRRNVFAKACQEWVLTCEDTDKHDKWVLTTWEGKKRPSTAAIHKAIDAALQAMRMYNTMAAARSTFHVSAQFNNFEE
jgi:hypothetical protein